MSGAWHIVAYANNYRYRNIHSLINGNTNFFSYRNANCFTNDDVNTFRDCYRICVVHDNAVAHGDIDTNCCSRHLSLTLSI